MAFVPANVSYFLAGSGSPFADLEPYSTARKLDLSSLHNFIAFAIGGLLGDVFFHLIPHAFMGGSSEDPAAAAAGLLDSQGVRVVMVEEKRNVIIGVGPARG